MTRAVRAWLDARVPTPPADLMEAVASGVREGPPQTVLAESARIHLEAARLRPGRDRDAAFELLAADALLTYACEAALEAEDPDEALSALIEVGEVR